PPYLGEPSDLDIMLELIKAKFNVNTITEAEDKVGRRGVFNGSLSLDVVAENTLGRRKTGHGANAPGLIREGKWAEVFEYNLHDVIITYQLLRFIKKYGYAIDGEGRAIRVDRERFK
ncbi:unnamed protein product, partial [marine sediment metagenome]